MIHHHMRLAISTIALAVLAAMLCRSNAVASLGESFIEVHKSLALVGSQTSLGTAFVVASDASGSTLLTAAHVVRDANRVDIYLHDDVLTKNVGTVIARSSDRDLALISVKVPHLTIMTIAAEVREGDSIAVAGYPIASLRLLEATNELKPSVHEGVISAVRLNGYLIEHSAVTDHGNSGGPLFVSSNASVVGVITGALRNANGAYLAAGLNSVRAFLKEHAVAMESVASSDPAQPLIASKNAYHFILPYTTRGATGDGDTVIRSAASTLAQKLGPILGASITTEESSSSIDWSRSSNFRDLCEKGYVGVIGFWVAWDGKSDPNWYSRQNVKESASIFDCYGGPVVSSFKEKTQSLPREIDVATLSSAFADLSDQICAEVKSIIDQFPIRQTVLRNLARFGIPIGDGEPNAFFYGAPADGFMRITIVAPFGTAARAGLQKDDLVVALNGTSLAGVSKEQFDAIFQQLPTEVSALVRGPDGHESTIVFSKRDIRWYLSHPITTNR